MAKKIKYSKAKTSKSNRKIKKYAEGISATSNLHTAEDQKKFDDMMSKYQQQYAGTTNTLPMYLQSPSIAPQLAADPQYNSLSANKKNNYAIDLSGYLNMGNKDQNTASGGSNTMDNWGTAAIIAGTAASLTQNLDSNPYNEQYGYQTSAAAGTASSAGPIGGAIGGVLETVGNVAGSFNEYNEYGYNEASVGQGSGYQYMESVLDPFSQWQTDIEEEQWGSSALTAAGLAPMTGLKQYQDEQKEAKKKMEEAERQASRARIENRYNTQMAASLQSKPTMMYPDGGTISKSAITKGDKYRDIAYTYADMHKTFGRDTNMVAGDMVLYDKPKYITTMPDTGSIRSTLNGQAVESKAGEMFGISDTDTNGVLTRRSRSYTDKRTGTVYNIPMIDSDVFQQYFPEAKAKYAVGGMVQGEPNAELEKGEPFRTPDGIIHKISDNAPTHAQGGVQLNLPEGTQILGKLEMYSKDKKFKEAGDKLKKMQDKYLAMKEGNSPVGKKTADMMLSKIGRRFDNLIAEQEAKLQAKENKRLKAEYAKGGIIKKYRWGEDYMYDSEGQLKDEYLEAFENIQNPSPSNIPVVSGKELSAIPEQYSNNPELANTYGYNDETYTGRGSAASNLWNKYGNTETLSTVAQLAPAAYNLYQGIFGTPEKVSASDYRNPYQQRAVNMLRGRKYNVEPELAANELAYQSGKRNIRQIAPSAGNLLSNYSALAGTRMRADAEALARKQNVEGQWAGENAQMLANMGANESQMRFNVDNINAQNRAAQQAYTSRGIDQLANAAYQMQSAKNEQFNSQALLDAYKAGMVDIDIDKNGRISWKKNNNYKVN